MTTSLPNSVSLDFRVPLNEADRLKLDVVVSASVICDSNGIFSTDLIVCHHLLGPRLVLSWLPSNDGRSVPTNSINGDGSFSSRSMLVLKRMDGRRTGHGSVGRAIGVA